MLKKCLFAAAILLAGNAFASAQDIFWSFSPTEVNTFGFGNLNCNPNTLETGSAYIFSSKSLGFQGLDLQFTSSDPDVIRFTGGEAFNPTFDVIGGTRFDTAEITVDADGSSGGLFLANVDQNGVVPNNSSFDPGFVAGAGPNGALLLARVDFEVVDVGALGFADLEFALGPNGIVQIIGLQNPSFGSATLHVSVPGCVLYGDVNLSGSVDFFDIAPFIAVLASGGFFTEADCNLDGAVDFLDIAPFIELLTSN